MPPVGAPPTRAPAAAASAVAPQWTPPPKRPTGIAILVVLDAIGIGLAALVGVTLLLLGPTIGARIAARTGSGFGAAAGTGFQAFGIFLIIAAAVALWIAMGLWNGKEWARVTTLVLSWVGLVLNALSTLARLARPGLLLGSVLGLAVEIVVIWYLMQPGVKSWFGPKPVVV
ncbi:MAG: hypothetical protein ACYDDF_11010 [Thermoplasmatota archaeon]